MTVEIGHFSILPSGPVESMNGQGAGCSACVDARGQGSGATNLNSDKHGGRAGRECRGTTGKGFKQTGSEMLDQALYFPVSVTRNLPTSPIIRAACRETQVARITEALGRNAGFCALGSRDNARAYFRKIEISVRQKNAWAVTK